MSADECPCLADSRQPYGWGYERYESLAERQTDWTRTFTIRCKACGRRYEVEADDTPATHTIHTWRELPPGTQT